MLVILCGLPGSGKSTVGALIAARIGAVILRTDEIRRELFPTRTYSSEESIAVYEAMMARAKTHLQAGTNVILDATYIAAAHRSVPLALARDLDVDSQIVHVTSTPELTKERLAARSDDPSEADYGIYLRLRDQFEEITEAHIRVENMGDLEALEEAVSRCF